MTFTVDVFVTATIEAKDLESAKQMLKDMCDRQGYVNLSAHRENDNGSLFMFGTIHKTQEPKEL